MYNQFIFYEQCSFILKCTFKNNNILHNLHFLMYGDMTTATTDSKCKHPTEQTHSTMLFITITNGNKEFHFSGRFTPLLRRSKYHSLFAEEHAKKSLFFICSYLVKRTNRYTYLFSLSVWAVYVEWNW